MKEAAATRLSAGGPFVGHLGGLGESLAKLVDELAHGVVVASPQGRLLHANQVARHELAGARVLCLRHGHLQPVDAGQGRALLQAFARGAAGLRSMVTLRAPAGWGLSIAVVPLRAAPGADPALGLFLSRASVCDSLMLCFFARSHGLTHTEEQVLAILAQGRSAPEIATQLNVAVSTIRTHVRSLCAKTQTNGVRALIGRLAVLPPLGPSLYHPVH